VKRERFLVAVTDLRVAGSPFAFLTLLAVFYQRQLLSLVIDSWSPIANV